MFKIEILEPFVLYLIQNNYFYLHSFKLSCKNFYEYTNNHNMYKKIYSCNLLNYHIQNRLKFSGFGYFDIKNILEINDIPNYSNKNNLIEIKRDFKTIINLFYNFNYSIDESYYNYQNKYYIYKLDKFDPLKNLPNFKRKDIHKRMKKSIYLNLALTNATYNNFSFIKAREIDEYYLFGEHSLIP